MIMSEESEADVSCCASCGITEIDDIKLVPCDDCYLVRYCSDVCRQDHKSEHEEVCEKRAAELRDELLFKQPEVTHLGDCPICMIPLPIDLNKSTMNMCCSKVICDGCVYATVKRDLEMRLPQSCPFCREPKPKTEEEAHKQSMRRIEMNDPAAMCQEGSEKYSEGDYQSAFEYYVKSAELGYAHAHWRLGCLYHEGKGVEQNEGKEIHHMEEAAIGGHPKARFSLAAHELNNGCTERAVKHWIIAATQGDDNSIKILMKAFKWGLLEKEDLDSALRAHKAAVDATKSPHRDMAEE